MSLAILAPLASKLIPIAAKGVVRLVERIKGNGKGETEKKPLAKGLLGDILALFKDKIPGLSLPQGGEIEAIIQAAFEELHKHGKLVGFDTKLEDDANDAPSKPLLLLCATLMEAEAARLRKLAV